MQTSNHLNPHYHQHRENQCRKDSKFQIIIQDKSLNEDETEWKQDTDSQVQEAEMEIETGKTADAADADAILDAEMQTPDEGVESPGREIREMLKNHDEPLEEWKD